jgi:hypothetical protein
MTKPPPELLLVDKIVTLNVASKGFVTDAVRGKIQILNSHDALAAPQSRALM